MRVLISCLTLTLLFVCLPAFPTTPEAPRMTTTSPPPTSNMSIRTRKGPEASFKDFFGRVDEFKKEKKKGEDLEKSYVATTPGAPKLRRRKTTTVPPPPPKLSNRTRMGPEANFKDFFSRVEEFTKEKERADLEKSYVARGFGAIVEI